jgi:transposase
LRSPRKSLANRCIPHRWGGCCASSACRDRRRGPAIRCKTRLPPRLLKKARRILQTIQRTHKRKRLRLFFQDEARIGQKGRVCHIWWKRGERPPGLVDQRYVNAYIYAAVEPGTDNAFALILPDANSASMQVFLDNFAKTVARGEHVALVLDGAGWHSGTALCVPANITLVPLPPYSPELNPVERVWLYLKQRFLSMRLLNDYNTILAVASKAWRRLCRETGRLSSLTSFPWIMKIKQVKL